MKLDSQTLLLVDRFRRALARMKSDNTARAYAGDVRTFAEFLVENRRGSLLDAREVDLSAYLSKTSAAVKPATLNRHRAGLAAFFEWSAQAGLTASLPVVAIAKKPDFDPVRHVQAFRTALQRYGTQRDRAICALVFDAGIPVNSVGSLRRSDLDTTGERWTLRLTNRRFLRRVSLPEAVRQSLADYLTSLGDEASKFVFPTRQAESMSFSTVPVIVQRYSQLAGLGRDLRSLRKAFALEATVRSRAYRPSKTRRRATSPRGTR